MAKIRIIDAFIDGKAFIKVSTPDANKKIMTQLIEEDCEALDKCCPEYVDDFGKNVYFDSYYLTYYKKQHALKAMCGEFFDKIYNSGSKTPYVFEM